MEPITWIYKCGTDYKYCKDGFCGRYNQLKEDDKFPAVEMSKEWEEATGRVWSRESIKSTFSNLVKNPYPKNEFEKFTKKIKSALRLSNKIIDLPEYKEQREQLIQNANAVLLTFMLRKV